MKRIFSLTILLFSLAIVFASCSTLPEDETPEPIYNMSTYTVQYYKTDLDGNYIFDYEEQFTARVGTSVTISKTFEGFTLNANSTLTKTIEADDLTRFTLYFTRNSYNIRTIDEYNGIRHNPYLYEKTINLQTPTADGHTFVGWFLDEEGQSPFTLTQMPAHEVIVYAIYS